jgi:uncharacterized protein (TIGR00255 family)
MIRSMTGYGQSELIRDGVKVTVELSSINNRFFEAQIRLPRRFSALEPKVRERIFSSVKRGKIFCFIGYHSEDPEAMKLIVNRGTAEEYVRALRELRDHLSLTGDVDVKDLISLNGVLESDETSCTTEAEEDHVLEAVDAGLLELVSMRELEGKRMADDIRPRAHSILTSVIKVRELSVGSVDAYRERLESRIRDILDDSVDPGDRIAVEAAMVAERSDITEECVRIDSHIARFLETLEAGEPAGKRLNFLLQELNREANTIGSKSISSDISNEVITLKEEIEKIREQVQNVE